MKKLSSIKYSATAFNVSMLCMRLAFGGMMLLNHGIPKMMKFEAKVNGFPDPLHIGHKWSLILVIFAEVFCSLFVIIGLFTRAAIIPLLITMLVAVFLVHLHDPLADMELALVYTAAYAVLLLCGPGRLSVDGMMGK
jgi:putative oxidoreductase